MPSRRMACTSKVQIFELEKLHEIRRVVVAIVDVAVVDVAVVDVAVVVVAVIYCGNM